MMLNTIKTFVLYIILLSAIVSIHEFGHLIAAKKFGVYCKEFAIGMGPVIYSHKFKETVFNIRALPLGGFVAMAGEPNDGLETYVDTSDIPFERTLKGIKRWKQIIIMLSGIFMNFVLAIVIYSLIILGNGQYAKESRPCVSTIVENMPASESSLEIGDIITRVEFDNGAVLNPETYSEVSVFTASSYDGKGPWHITVDRNGVSKTIDITPIYDDVEARYLIGIQFTNEATNIKQVNLLNCWYYGLDFGLMMLRIIWTSLLSIFKGIGLDKMSGPIGIYQTVETVVNYGPIYYLELIALISINAAAFNALPLPIFDGGRVLLSLIEMIIGKPLSKRSEDLIMKISLAIILSLFIYVSFNDVLKLFRG